MRIILEDTNEEFHVNPDTGLEVELTQPFFTDQGSQSLPITLPGSPHNLEISNHPQRFMRRQKYEKKRKVRISAGTFFKSATMEFFSGNKKNGIVTTFHLSEGELYTIVSETKMVDVFANIVRADFPTVPTWLDYLTKVMTGEQEDDFRIFPVSTKVIELDVPVGSWIPTEKLNDVNVDKVSTAFDGKPFFKLMAYDVLITKENDELITLPIGYGVTPFLKLKYILKKIFEHFGYNLLPSLFDSDISLKSAVILNNTADAILKSKIEYSQLVPNCTVFDFLKAIRKRFCCDFFESEDGKSIEIRFFRDIISEEPDIDLSKFIDGEPVYEYETPKQIKLSSSRSLDLAKMSISNYPDFIRNHTIVGEVNRRQNKPTVSGVYYVRSSGEYYAMNVLLSLICPDLFDYCENIPGYKTEDHSSPDENMPMIDAIFLRENNTGETMLTPYIGSRQHLNSFVKMSTGEEKEEKEEACKIMFCFALGRAKKYSEGNSADHFFAGSTVRYDNLGGEWGTMNLAYAGPHGLYNLFWKNYDKMLNNSTIEGVVKLVLPEEKIRSFRMDKLKVVYNQLVFPISLKYKIQKDKVEVIEFRFRTVKEYE